MGRRSLLLFVFHFPPGHASVRFREQVFYHISPQFSYLAFLFLGNTKVLALNQTNSCVNKQKRVGLLKLTEFVNSPQ